MTKPSKRDFANALDELEALRASGKISEGKYLTHREAILQDMKNGQNPVVKVIIVLVVVIVGLLIIARIASMT